MTKLDILVKLAKNEITADEADAMLTAIAESMKPAASALSVKANPEKRTISLYGLQRMPISLHRSQWERLLKGITDRASHPVLSFIDKHSEYLPEEKGAAAKEVPASMIGESKDFRLPKGKEATVAA